MSVKNSTNFINVDVDGIQIEMPTCSFVFRLKIPSGSLQTKAHSLLVQSRKMVSVKRLTLSLPECLMEFCKVTPTFESADEIL